jgi:predicted CXXCH cytochrome family protein
MAIPDKQICRDCHSSGDSKFRLAFAPDTTGTGGIFEGFTGHHGEGDEYRRSPHKDQDCVLCHDPHKSVWGEDGGVLYSEVVGEGKMCTQCHDKRVRGSMGEEGMDLECTACHMPEKSGAGDRATHLFRINATALDAKDNVRTELNDSGAAKTYWGKMGLNGDDGFLTLDMVCARCHDQKTMPLDKMAKTAKAVHRQPGLVDLTVNRSDSVQVVTKADIVSVDFSLLTDTQAGKKADWWVLCQTPKGWTSWDGKKWKAGRSAWRKKVPLADVPAQNVLRSKLSPGFYTYWVQITPSDSSQKFTAAYDSVPVYVTK